MRDDLLSRRLRHYFVDSSSAGFADRPEILETTAQAWQDKAGRARPGDASQFDPEHLEVHHPSLLRAE